MTPMTSCLSTECKKRLQEGGLLVDEKLEVRISKLHVTLGKTLTSPSLASSGNCRNTCRLPLRDISKGSHRPFSINSITPSGEPALQKLCSSNGAQREVLFQREARLVPKGEDCLHPLLKSRVFESLLGH